MAAPSWKEQLRAHLLASRLTWNDRLMLGLAVLDVVLLAIRRDVELPGDWETTLIVWIHRVDFALLAIFGVEFLVSLAVARQRLAFLKANWYDLVGLIPIHSPLLRAFRLGRAIRVYVWGSRYPSEVEEKYGGEAYVLHVLRRYEPVLVEELTDPLLVRVLGVLRRVVGEAHFANAVGAGLQERRETIRQVVVDSIHKSPALRVAYGIGPVRAGIDEVEKQSVDVAIAALTDPRLDDVIRGSIDDALAGLQARVAEKDWQKTATLP